MERNIYKIGKELFVTNDEEIKEGDWFYNTVSLKPEPFKACENGDGYVNCSKYSHYRIDCKKIILTDNPDLIKDGVQAIDDEFLEWFVKNPSCEFVEVKKNYLAGYYAIPKQEPKQETLEEFAKKSVEIYVNEREKQTAYLEIIRGAKWQQQQNKNLYSEQTVTEYAYYFESCYAQRPMQKPLTPSEWFEQFKKK